MNLFRSTPSSAAADRSTRTWSVRSDGSRVSVMSSSSSSSSGLSNVSAYDHLPAAAGDGSPARRPEEEDEEVVVVGVAVTKEMKECKANLLWVLSNMDAILMNTSNDGRKKKATVVLLHVHRPAKTIPFMGAYFPADQLHESEVTAFRQAEVEVMNKAMARYRAICGRVKVQAVCRVETDAADDVAQGILRLVAHNGITRLVIGAAADKRYTKKMTAPTSKTAQSVQEQAHPLCTIWFLCKGNLICTRLGAVNVATMPRNTGHPAAVARASSSSKQSDERAEALPAAAETRRPSSPNGREVQLGAFFIRSSLRRNDDDDDSFDPHGDGEISRKPTPTASSLGDRWNGTVTAEKPSWQSLVPADGYNKQMQEAEKLRREQRHSSSDQHKAVQHQDEQAQVIADLQDKLSEAHCMLFSLERDQDELRRQRDAAVREAAALRERVRHLEDQLLFARGFTELSYGDLQEATSDLDEALKLGGGGSVYKAVLRPHHDEAAVAIKVLNPHGNGKFRQQVQGLAKLRHPNVVPLLGACSAPEALALVYELLPGGSLEDRLQAGRQPLPWPDRTRIAAEIRSALVFLHQSGMVHGDLKPSNVLLDGGLTAKLADYGLCRLLELDAGAVLLRCTSAGATSLAYMDPEFMASGELRPSSDVYAFGVLLLRLLTGRLAMGLVRQVQAALPEGRLPQILDASAGEWPYPPEQAEQLAQLGVACCEIASNNRPDLAGDMVTQALGCYLRP